ncbi:MAG: discoidin domain-containing protein [Fuerstiella sp.]
MRGGSAKDGEVVYRRVCASCHMIGEQGNAFGPKLDGVASRNSKEQIIRHVLYPNETIAKGYETVLIITVQGKTHTGFILDEDDQQIVLGVATDDGKGKRLPIAKDDIDEREEMKASSMPEGLVKTIAPAEFLDLIEFLAEQSMFVITKDGWIETGLADDGALRKKGEFIEVSRDAELQLGSGFEDRYSKFAHLVLSAVGASNHEFLFHSAGGGSNNPAIAIRLKQPTEIRAIDIQNRRNRQFYDRAKDMAVWISDDGKDWQQVWKSKKPAENYSIELPAGTTARYVKIGIDGRGILHLNQVVVYGSAGN